MCVDIINIKGFGSSRAQMFFKTALKNFAIFLGKHLCLSPLYFVFSSEYCKILKAFFFTEHLSGCFWGFGSFTRFFLLFSHITQRSPINLDFAADPVSYADFKHLSNFYENYYCVYHKNWLYDVQRYISQEKMFGKYAAKLQENTHAEVQF